MYDSSYIEGKQILHHEGAVDRLFDKTNPGGVSTAKWEGMTGEYLRCVAAGRLLPSVLPPRFRAQCAG